MVSSRSRAVPYILEELEQSNIGIIASCQEEPSPELAAKFGEPYHLDEEQS